jgi:hypothetical protein
VQFIALRTDNCRALTRSALSISGDGDSIYSKSKKTRRRRQLNVSRTVKPHPFDVRALDESDTSK